MSPSGLAGLISERHAIQPDGDSGSTSNDRSDFYRFFAKSFPIVAALVYRWANAA
jgi:hypothetical protein